MDQKVSRLYPGSKLRGWFAEIIRGLQMTTRHMWMPSCLRVRLVLPNQSHVPVNDGGLRCVAIFQWGHCLGLSGRFIWSWGVYVYTWVCGSQGGQYLWCLLTSWLLYPCTYFTTPLCSPHQLQYTSPITALLTSYCASDLLPRHGYIHYIKRAYLSTSCSSSLSMNYHRLHSTII